MEEPPHSVARTLPLDHRPARIAGAIRANFTLLLGLAAMAWGLEVCDLILFGALDSFGIQPRKIHGLVGVAAAPFLHLGFGHLVSNTLPFLILGGIVLIGGRKIFLLASLLILAIGGGAVWTLGPGATNHLGASGLIFGYLGFLLARGVVEKSLFWIVVSLIVLMLYGSMIAGVLPGQRGISWQGHLFGFIGGIIAAKVLFTKERLPSGS